MSGETHALTLKVMRLSRPSFASIKYPLYVEPTESYGQLVVGGGSLNQILNADLNVPQPGNSEKLRIQDWGSSELLLFPGSFGSIYLGEIFTAYLCLNNDAPVAVKDIVFVAELQTSTQRFSLCDTTNYPTGNLLSSQAIEYIVSHEIKELGVHVLVCMVSYNVQGERKSFRKVYKFQVLNPLAVKTKINQISEGRILLEAQVQNITQSPMLMERMNLDPNSTFHCQDLTITSNDDNVFGDFSHIQPQDIRQYLFLLSPKKDDFFAARTATALGKLDMIWRSTFGEPGRLQTGQLSRKAQPLENVDISLHDVPTNISVYKPFIVKLLVRNGTNQSISPVISLKSRHQIIPYGKGCARSPVIAPFESVIVDFQLYALQCGIQKIDGFRIGENTEQGRELDINCEIYVQSTM